MKTRILTIAALALLAITTTASSANAAWIGVNIGTNASRPFGPRPFAPVVVARPFAPVVVARPFAPVVVARPFAPVVVARPFVNPPSAVVNAGPVRVRIR